MPCLAILMHPTHPLVCSSQILDGPGDQVLLHSALGFRHIFMCSTQLSFICMILAWVEFKCLSHRFIFPAAVKIVPQG